MDRVFLTLGEVVEIHRNQIELYGGNDGIRDLPLLQSAMGMPQAAFGGAYLHSDVCETAAAYLFHIVRNHAFIDGNKRTGVVAAYVFLELNGLELVAAQNELEEIARGVAAGNVDKARVTEFLRQHTKNTITDD